MDSLHQRVTISIYSGTCPTAEPMPLSDIPCGHPKFNSNPSTPVSAMRGIISFQCCSSQGTITDATKARSGKSVLIRAISSRLISNERSVISSILFNPKRRRSAPHMAPYLGPFTFTIGGPSEPRVFHTTPPQPASKALRTLYSLSVGGAEASQNGFGDEIPQKFEVKSAIILLP